MIDLAVFHRGYCAGRSPHETRLKPDPTHSTNDS